MLDQVVERGVGRGQGQRVTHERAGEVGDAHGRDRGVAELPVAAVERVHPGALAGDDADGLAAAHHLAVRGEIGPHTEMGLRAARVQAEASDDLVEDQRRSRLLGDAPDLVEELAGLEVRAPALHGLHQHGRELTGTRAQHVQGLVGAVVQHQHVLHRSRHDARGRRDRPERLGSPDDHLIEDAVVSPREDRDGGAAGHGACDAHGAHHRLRAGVAKADSIHAGQLADLLRHLTRQRMLRTELVAALDLLLQRLGDEARRVAEEVRAEPVQRVDVLVAIEVPETAARRAIHHDLVDELLQDRAEAGHHPRVREVRAVLLRVLLRPARLFVVALGERLEAPPLLGRQLLPVREDAGDGPERLLRIVGLRAGFGGVRRRLRAVATCGDGQRSHRRRGHRDRRRGRRKRRRRLNPRRRRGGHHRRSTEQRELLLHQPELLLDQRAHVARPCHSDRRRRDRGRAVGEDRRGSRGRGRRRCDLERGHGGRSHDRRCGLLLRQLVIQMLRQHASGGHVLQQLAEGHVHPVATLKVQRHLRQGQ